MRPPRSTGVWSTTSFRTRSCCPSPAGSPPTSSPAISGRCEPSSTPTTAVQWFHWARPGSSSPTPPRRGRGRGSTPARSNVAAVRWPTGAAPRWADSVAVDLGALEEPVVDSVGGLIVLIGVLLVVALRRRLLVLGLVGFGVARVPIVLEAVGL